ncbi:MAG: hypothetical protein KKE23_00115 [Nanoarchaeota archaeon]|nr:hypothetical protein [Nanoarchaeota archaeon]
MVSREELKEIKNYLSKELSKSYDFPTHGHIEMTVFEPHKNIKIEESRQAGDITRNVYYITGDLNSYVGYVSFFKKRDQRYTVCIADGEGMVSCKRANLAASKFASTCLRKIEEIIWDHEHTPKKEPHHSKIDPKILHEDHGHY